MFPTDRPVNRLGIIAGEGAMPAVIADAGSRAGRPVHLFCVGDELPERATAFAHSVIPLGAIGALVRALRRQDCRDVCIIGNVRRPPLGKLVRNPAALLSLPTLLRLMIGGDDSVLRRIVGFFESKGFAVLGAHQIAPELLVPVGVLGRRQPSRADNRDIAIGMRVVAELGRLDVGQGAVVARGHVLAVEAAEGTDRMLERCGALRQWGRRRHTGVFCKRAKPGQEMRIDMPVIGTETLRRAAAAGLAGIAVMAGEVMMAEPHSTSALADELGLFLVGVVASDKDATGG